MQLSDLPSKFVAPFANQAGAGFIRVIPPTPTGVSGQASLQEGFPPSNFTPVSGGGVPPFGQDFNGLLNQATAWNRWQATGAFPPYDATFQTAVGGYPKSAIVSSLVEDGLFWLCLVDNNVTNPDTGGAGWFVFSRIITANKDIYVSPSGSDSNNGLSPATALLTLQAAFDLAYSYGPTPYTVTIHVADSLAYAGVVTSGRAAPQISLVGNVGTPANVQINGGTGYAIAISGPNLVNISGVTWTNNIGSDFGAVVASGGASVICTGNRSLVCGRAVFQASQSRIISNSHTFAGGAAAAWLASDGGFLVLNTSAVYTFASALTFSIGTARATAGGSLAVAAVVPTFVNPGNVSGPRYEADFNGIINTGGGGANFFPGSTAGSTTTGGQYG